jgi:hypothetical protein
MHHRAIDASATMRTAPGSPGPSLRTGHRCDDAVAVCAGARTTVRSSAGSAHDMPRWALVQIAGLGEISL